MASQRTFSILGDSISTYEGAIPEGFEVFYTKERADLAGLEGVEDTWWRLVADALGARVIANASYSGSMVQGGAFPAATSPERIAALTGPNGERPTDVLIFMGTNDYGWGSPEARDAARITGEVAGAAPHDAAGRFADAYALMLSRVHDACPEATVWCMSLMSGRLAGACGPAFCHNLRDVPMSAYRDAVARLVGERPWCRWLDVSSHDYEAIDGTHPTCRGMRQIAALVLAQMGQAALDPEPFGGDADAWRAQELCPQRACLGCEHARNTGNAWSCVCEKAL